MMTKLTTFVFRCLGFTPCSDCGGYFSATSERFDASRAICDSCDFCDCARVEFDNAPQHSWTEESYPEPEPCPECRSYSCRSEDCSHG